MTTTPYAQRRARVAQAIGPDGIALIPTAPEYPRNRDNGQTLQLTPKRTVFIDLDRTFGAFSAGASWRAAASTARFASAALAD